VTLSKDKRLIVEQPISPRMPRVTRGTWPCEVRPSSGGTQSAYLVRIWPLGRSLRMSSHFHRYMFISGLREDLRSEVLRHDVRTLDEAREQARRAEFLRNQNQLKPAAISAIFVDELSALLDQVMSLDARDDNEEELRDEEIAAINAYRGKRGRKPYRGGQRRRVAAQSNSNSAIKCFNCDKLGHIAQNCRAPKRENQIRAIQEEEEKPLLKLSPLNW